jgi:hypothetical protein
LLGALRDMRIWLFIGLGVVLSSAMWAVLALFVAGTLSAREAELSRLTPEQRLQAELETVDQLSREMLGVEAGIPVAELTEEQRLAMDELAGEDFELAEEEPIGLVPSHLKPVRDERLRVPPPPPPGFQRSTEAATPVSPALAALGCGGVIVLFGLIGTAVLFWPRETSA